MRRTVTIPLLGIIILCVLLIISIFLLVNAPSDSAIGWGDNNGGRPSYTQEQINSGILEESILFNSISDGVIGDEKNFVGARMDTGENDGANNIWEGNEITVENGRVYLIRAYVHNNSPLGYDATAKNVKVAFNVPEESNTSVPVHGFIFCDNASPSKYWDGVLFKSDIPFHLEYISGSAELENNEIGANGGAQLSDEIVTKAASNNGTLIGYDVLDGKIPGGLQYACYVGIKVIVVFDADHTIAQDVRISGMSEWDQSVEAHIGDEIEFQMEYRNNGDTTQENVMIRDILPSNMEYASGSTKLYNSKHPEGASILENTVTTTGINIGNYASGANAYIRFTAKIVDIDLESGSNMLVNWSQCGVGEITIQDYAYVIVNKDE